MHSKGASVGAVARNLQGDSDGDSRTGNARVARRGLVCA
jgi:hypothetical protein